MSARPLEVPAAPVSDLQARDQAPPRLHVASGPALTALVDAYRAHGHRVADLDPLGVTVGDPSGHAALEGALARIDLPAAASGTVEWAGEAQSFTIALLLWTLRETYCGTLALQAEHLRSDEQRRWLYAAVERRAATALDAAAAARALQQLVAAETFEAFQRARYPRAKQYSVEGCEALLPLLDQVLTTAADDGVADVVVGMAHRGRMSAVANVLGLDKVDALSLYTSRPAASLDAWDLKEHVGFSRTRRFGERELALLVVHNPSHLGSVSPVVCGIARALQDRAPEHARSRVLPLLVHGDAAFPGQGVVVETLNLSQTRGYTVGGTLHVIVNNQIGSTIAEPRDARSTLYAADIARAIDAPILHANADDPEAVLRAAAIATAFRNRFACDVVVDLCGYRRIGHFGGDDPTMTQPATQRRIRAHPTAATRYAQTLVRRGAIQADSLERMRVSARETLEQARAIAEGRAVTALGAPVPGPVPAEAEVATAVPLTELREIVAQLARNPADIALHANVERRRGQWASLALDGDGPVDWCLAETLAYATLLRNGYNVRLTGLDVGRGTFFHRDAVWHDQDAERDGTRFHIPLRHLGARCGHFAIFESPLSEEAVVGFEYGYSLRCGRDLVVWEAQFGDFVNNAQVLIDQFIASGERKWGYESGLVLMLPHGAEGNGPEHSTGYVGRFLALCGENNLRVAMPSSAGQLHHLLRRQALMPARKPLVVMIPKFALRPRETSWTRLSDLSAGAFTPLLPVGFAAPDATRVVIASGKLLRDLEHAQRDAGRHDVALLGLEALHPFPASALARELARRPALVDVCFAQEEPRNYGAWHVVRDAIEEVLPERLKLRYAGPPAGAASGGCDAVAHAREQQAIVADALR